MDTDLSRQATSQSIAARTEAGELDAELCSIAEALNGRFAELARLRAERTLAQIGIGSRVIIGADAQPKHLRGMTGEVHEIDGDVVVVCLGGPVGKFKSGHVRCPPELLTPLIPLTT